MAGKTVTKYLIARANGDVRVVTMKPKLRSDEVAWRVCVYIPETWGRVLADSIDIYMPEPPEAELTVSDTPIVPAAMRELGVPEPFALG